MTLMIREAREPDFGAITTITNHYITTTSIHFAYEPVSPAELVASWAKAAHRYPWLVVTDGDGCLGYAKAGVWRDRAAYRWTAEIGLYVHHDHHRRGLGRRLYAELLATLAARGFRSAIAGITLPNDPSIALHRDFGFVSVGTVRDAGYKAGAWHDVEFWQKQLATGSEPPA
ncbi:MAG: N-acetyltransferase family protein [Kofleriaceae bacterium]